MSTGVRTAQIVFFVLLSGVLGASAVLLTPPGSSVAAWWPAAGTSVIAVFLARRYWWAAAVGIALITAVSNVVGGRTVPISLVFGIVNAAEASIVVLLLARYLPSRTLRSVGDAIKFFVISAVGSAALGVMVGLAVWGLLGGDPVTTFAEVVPSHLSALMVIVPVVLVSWRAVPRVSWELPLQVVALIGIILIVFGPSHGLPLTFLPLPLLTWAAIRFGLAVVSVELLGTAIASLTLTMLGGGPFSHLETEFTGSLLQIYFVACAVSLVLLGAVAAERETALARVRASEELLRSGLLGAQIGLLIVARDDTGTRLVETNAAASAVTAAGEHGAAAHLTDPDLMRAIDGMWNSSETQWSGEWDTDAHLRLQGLITRTAENTLSVQVIDVTARHRAEQVTAAALEKELAVAEALRALNQRQDEFVASVSHELRTPISSVIGFTEELRETELDDTQLMFTTVIARNGRRLLALVNNLLTLAALDRGDTPVTSEPVPIARLVTEVTQDLSALAKTGGIALRFDSGTDVTVETSHQQELTQILTNLTGNAVKFTPSGGEVTLGLATVGTDAVITVRDTGRGIPPEELEAVFGRFVRASSSGGTQGTGLGLSIVKQLVDSLGGTLALESDGVSGTTATVTLPLSGR